MAKQLKLTTKQFRELVGCSIDQAAYEQHLVENNQVTIEEKSDGAKDDTAVENGDSP